MIKKLIVSMAIMCLGTLSYAEEKDKVHMFPEAEEGFVKYVIEVPETDNDYDHKVELLIGKEVMVDCNGYSLSGKIENITLKGWGYKYLKISDIHRGPSTLMHCSEEKTKEFVTLYMGEEALRRYNHRSPIVVYIPKEYELRYRVWSADNEVHTAKQH